MAPDIFALWPKPESSRIVKPEVFSKFKWTRRWGILAETENSRKVYFNVFVLIFQNI